MSKQYYPVIGLEIHAELNTDSKMFCACKNDPNEEKQNTNICPICMAHPGTLPMPNKEAIKKVIQVGLALGSEIANFTEFDRKNYFYPDIPKGYQISQYKYPIVSGGALNLPAPSAGGQAGGFAITRIHLEEDTGLSKHDRGNYSLVDYNRAGVPLMELVTEPVLHSAGDAADFARELQTLLRTLGVSEANLEKGEMRVEPNISLSVYEEGDFGLNQFGELVDRTGQRPVLGTKVEVKNLNSFKSVEKAIEYELTRMQALYEAGRQDEIVQETRGWDEVKQSTFSQRSKENANDYRYFPDPDIPKFYLHELFSLDEIKASLPELPAQKRARYSKAGLAPEMTEILVSNGDIALYLEEVMRHTTIAVPMTLCANYLISDLAGLIKKDPSVYSYPRAQHFASLMALITENKLTSRGAKDILENIAKEDADPLTIAEKEGLLQKNDPEALREIARTIIASQEKIVADYRGGKESAVQALVGFMMKETKGSANPAVALEVLKEELSK